jgi:hypothetical protein
VSLGAAILVWVLVVWVGVILVIPVALAFNALLYLARKTCYTLDKLLRN